MIRLALALALLLPAPAMAQDGTALKAALRLAAARDWSAALGRAEAGVPRDIVEWQRLRAGNGTAGEYEAFLARNPDWPGIALLRRRGEGAIAGSGDAQRIIAYFAQQAPLTAEGAIALSRAFLAANRAPEAEAEAIRAWRDMALTEGEEAILRQMYPVPLAGADIARTDRLLWDGEMNEALRMVPRLSAGWQALARARIALRSGDDGVDAMIAAVPEGLSDDPGLAYERFMWRIRKGRDADAAALMLNRSGSAESLGRPAEWASRRAYLAREFEEADPTLAYSLAASHHLTSGGSFADLEFLAGHIALRRLNQPSLALDHFRRLGQGVSTPISLSRALYWEGRALEEMGNFDAAMAAFEEASMHSSAYYGLLAAERLGKSIDPALLSDARPADWRQAGFAQSSVFQAAQMLLDAGDYDQGRRFILHLAESQDATGLDQLADMALAMNEPNIAVLIGKQAAERGIILPRAYYPVPAMVPDDLPVTRALALAISRRESEFNPVVVSPAGARGLMQVMPGTAKLMATKLGTDYAASRLSDPAYNVRMGTAYLAQLIEEFGPSVALVASGYNAGPGRPRGWVTQFGDPRDPGVDVVDWVEDIPFGETRTYVMRVVESLVIYRAKLAGVSIPVRVTAELRG
ncbi:lytic transglycosylase domain-containing protein [Falsirhodobacter xinxiangensis]|uniref:lytic transglycosylase domain-containing protein n=1 Tax=Falsirhodobacter xinxiangensis TaxID=2530049 RepID=UPI0010AAF3B5|nr:lytic transglycosylase domain-containing protein [Rhodobacter xinxiangensis]